MSKPSAGPACTTLCFVYGRRHADRRVDRLSLVSALEPGLDDARRVTCSALD